MLDHLGDVAIWVVAGVAGNSVWSLVRAVAQAQSKRRMKVKLSYLNDDGRESSLTLPSDKDLSEDELNALVHFLKTRDGA